MQMPQTLLSSPLQAKTPRSKIWETPLPGRDAKWAPQRSSLVQKPSSPPPRARILHEAEPAGRLLVLVQAHDDALDVPALGEELVDLLLRGVEGEVAHVQRGGGLQLFRLLLLPALQSSPAGPISPAAVSAGPPTCRWGILGRACSSSAGGWGGQTEGVNPRIGKGIHYLPPVHTRPRSALGPGKGLRPGAGFWACAERPRAAAVSRAGPESAPLPCRTAPRTR